VYPAPPDIATAVWARLPQSLRVTNPRSPWTATRFAHRPDSFLEGPSFDSQGNLYVVDIPHGRVFKVAPDATFSPVAEYDGEPNGLKIRQDGAIFIADFQRGILRLDPATGAVETVVGELPGGPLKGPNDLYFADNGDLYFTDQGDSGLTDASGRLVCLRADGSVEVLLDTLPSPNGLVMNRAQTVLFLAMTRDNAVWRVPLPPRGEPVRRVGVAIQLSGGNGPDGLAMDEDDTLFVAHNGLGCIWAFDRWGEPVWRIRSCEGRGTTNLAFGGTDRRSLFITESQSGTILRAELPTPGQRMPSGC
jgi:gluconolactonase